MKNTTLLLALLTLATTPLAAAGPADDVPALGFFNDCHNSGVIVVVGSYVCNGAPCTNSGVVVWVGSTCHARGGFGACAIDWCSSDLQWRQQHTPDAAPTVYLP